MLSLICALLLCAGLVTPVEAAAKRSSKRSASAAKSKVVKARGKRSTRKGRKTAARRPRGQQAISPERVQAIQEALIRQKYMEGEPNGVMDARTKDALVKLQRERGWQSKVVPDSRALIALGLGPDHSEAINADVINKPELAKEQMPGGSEPQ